MITINENYLKLKSSYLFSDVAKRVDAFRKAHPERDIVRLGIGDATRALPARVHRGLPQSDRRNGERRHVPRVRRRAGIWLSKEKIAEGDFQARGADISADEIFVSDGAKCDTGNFQELFSTAARIAIPDPVYPVYVDSNVMAGRTGAFENGRYAGIYYLESTAKNSFVPELPAEHVDLRVPLFSQQSRPAPPSPGRSSPQWVDWARASKALILFDAAYVAFIRDDSLPQSIFEIPGARDVAVEFRSYSKTAGFTGTRCAYTVVPEILRRLRLRRKAAVAPCAVEQAPHHQVQRRLLHGAARRGGALFAGRTEAGAGN